MKGCRRGEMTEGWAAERSGKVGGGEGACEGREEGRRMAKEGRERNGSGVDDGVRGEGEGRRGWERAGKGLEWGLEVGRRGVGRRVRCKSAGKAQFSFLM
jgi:hypothetical protein